MKNLICLFIFICPVISVSQTAASVFTSDSIVFYGLDFSNCRLIGDFGNGDGYAMKNKMFPQWNHLILKEAYKYDIQNSFRKPRIYYDFNPVASQNSTADETKILTYNDDHVINKDNIAAMIKKYPRGDKTAGIGLVFIVEKFNKNALIGIVHITFFDIASKTVLFTEPMHGEPGGAGLRNYWARVIYNILNDINMFAYNNWKHKYTGK